MKTNETFRRRVREIVNGAVRSGAISPASRPYHLATVNRPEMLERFRRTYTKENA